MNSSTTCARSHPGSTWTRKTSGAKLPHTGTTSTATSAWNTPADARSCTSSSAKSPEWNDAHGAPGRTSSDSRTFVYEPCTVRPTRPCTPGRAGTDSNAPVRQGPDLVKSDLVQGTPNRRRIRDGSEPDRASRTGDGLHPQIGRAHV